MAKHSSTIFVLMNLPVICCMKLLLFLSRSIDQKDLEKDVGDEMKKIIGIITGSSEGPPHTSREHSRISQTGKRSVTPEERFVVSNTADSANGICFRELLLLWICFMNNYFEPFSSHIL